MVTKKEVEKIKNFKKRFKKQMAKVMKEKKTKTKKK